MGNLSIDDRLVIINNAKFRIIDPRQWTTCTWARDRHGRAVDPRSPLATSWSMLGIVMQTTGTILYNDMFRTIVSDLIEGACYAGLKAHTMDDLCKINDRCLHCKTILIFDKTIATLERRQKRTK